MKTGRLEAFSDGVLAIIITIMVLEIKDSKRSKPAGLIKKQFVNLSFSYNHMVSAQPTRKKSSNFILYIR